MFGLDDLRWMLRAPGNYAERQAKAFSTLKSQNSPTPPKLGMFTNLQAVDLEHQTLKSYVLTWV